MKSDLDEALMWAATLPSAAEGSVEVRPLVPVTPAPPVPEAATRAPGTAN